MRTLMSPWLPEDKAQKVERKHTGLQVGAEEGFIKASIIEDILKKKTISE